MRFSRLSVGRGIWSLLRHRLAFYAILSIWLYFIILSILFASERILWYDWAYFFYRIAGLGDVGIDHWRYIHILPHGLAWLGVKLGASFKGVLLLCSVGYLLPGFLGSVLVWAVGRQVGGGWLAFLPALPYLLSREVFYSLNSVTLALSAAGSAIALWLIALHTERRHIGLLGVGFLLASLALFMGHPISGFLLMAGAIANLSHISRRGLLIALIPLFLAPSLVALKYFVFLTEYEKSKAVPLSDLLAHFALLLKGGIRSSRMGAYILGFYPQHHLLTLGCVILFSLYALIWYRWRGALLLLSQGGVGIAVAIYLVIYLWKGEHPAAMEFYGLILPVTVVSGFMIGVSFLQKNYERIGATGLMGIILIENGHHIWAASRTLKMSLGHTRRLVESCRREGEFKSLVHPNSVTPEVSYYVWTAYALPMATLLYSGSLSRDSSVVITMWGDLSFLDSLARTTRHEFILGPFWHWLETRFDQLNPQYFSVPPSPYRIITHLQDQRVYEALEKGQIQLQPKDTLLRFLRYSGYSSGYLIAEVVISQQYGSRLPCLPTDSVAVGVSYEIYDSEGRKKSEFHPFNNWERDLPPQYVQGVFISHPGKSGVYEVQFGFLSRKHGFIPSGRRIKLIVD
ncbi:MAG: hypothetical protein RMK19_06635 [Bacteroidia bacterium]|nr:hypothetical protein [Bacteroidia bacterium]MDW8015671.1 hypothetical protein [Bacteroidia bacterium]